ncbi:Acetyltransferase involved in MEL production [Sporisorium reilianum f. sp. reilianum]|uniref:Acetyltransferase involved in MEL production n=1 Tax=Sporisorium reilianum f. sp. reilianum TaxID=72559 RepID=A0A2N8UEF8_9BASI|nr:Acetyltransferase involved in MEL production [Sporisorium reilianum f. sp. reilianum]
MKQKADAVLPGYEPVPLPVFDATLGNTDILTRIGLVFPGGLSLERLQESWFDLVRAWPILAARIRPTPSTPSGLSYFVPTASTLATLEARSRDPNTQPLHKHIAIVDASARSISTFHAIAGQSVHAQLDRHEVSVGEGPDPKERDAMTCCNACTSWTQLLVTDQAYLTAQATRWSDATSVTISFSHVAGDAYTIKSILDAWQTTLGGQPIEGVRDLGKDPFIKLMPQEGVEEELPLGWCKLGIVRKIKLIGNLLWDIKVRRPEKTFRQYYVYMPQAKLDELMQQARLDLEQLAAADAATASSSAASSLHSDEKHPTPREYTVSTFNVLYAWLLQNVHAASHNPRTMSNALTIVNPKIRPPLGHVDGDYPAHQLWGGTFAAVVRDLSARDYATLPIGQVALHIRESLKEQVTPKNMRDNLAMLLRHTMWKKPSGELVFWTKRTSNYWFGSTEWRSAKFAEVDFSAAAATAEKERGKINPVAMSAHMEIPMTPRNRWVIFGEAGQGVWFSGGLTSKEAHHKNRFGRYIWVK